VSYANSPDVNIVSIDRPIIAGDWWPRPSVYVYETTAYDHALSTQKLNTCAYVKKWSVNLHTTS